MPKKLTVIPEKCSGCKMCELACAIKHFGVNNPKKSAVRVLVTYPHPVVRMPIVCSQCKKPPCESACPVGALSRIDGVVKLDEQLCISCFRCVDACPYSAIIRQVRPCAAACGMDAISSDELGRANIDYDKCVSCGMCIVNCPFGAISDKGQLFQLIHAINDGERVFAAVAPSFVGQLGPKVTPERLKGAM